MNTKLGGYAWLVLGLIAVLPLTGLMVRADAPVGTVHASALVDQAEGLPTVADVDPVEVIEVTPSPPIIEAAPVLREPSNALRQSLRHRLEFETLGLELTGVARTHEKWSCFLKHNSAQRPMLYNEGDVIGGYRIVSIREESVILDRQGSRFWLGTGDQPALELAEHHDEWLEDGQSPLDIPEEVLHELDGVMDDLNVPRKHAPARVKRLTERYDSAILIEDGSNAGPRVNVNKNLRQMSNTLFIVPMEGRLTSTYGYRKHPMGGGRKFHSGIDIAARHGSAVRAAADGIVTKVRYGPTIGRYVEIDHENGYKTRYGHLSKQEVKEGQRVRQNEIIAREGSTGRSTGPHLHFEIYKNGYTVNPLSYVQIGN